MATNPTPLNRPILCALCEDLADGCHLHEVAIGIKQNTETVLRAALAGADATELALANANGTVSAKYDLLQTADAAGETVLKNCRLRFVKLFGGKYNAQWQAAGWPDGTTAIPENQDERFTLLNKVKNYLTATPASESVDMEATAAITGAAHTAVSNARAAVNSAEQAQGESKDADAAAYKTLRKRVRGLIEELGTLLADDDLRYRAFGLNVPANPSPPDAIEVFTLTALGNGKVHAQWDYSTRLTSTRLLVKRTGVDDEFVSVGTSDGLEKVLTGYTAGQTIEAKAIAYNDGGDAPPSPVASVVVT